MSEKAHEKLGEIMTRCAKDAAFRARFKANAAGVLAENGITVPSGTKVHVVENTDQDVYLTLPPVAGAAELSEAELEGVAGGVSALNISARNLSAIYRYVATRSSSSGSTCYKDCVPW